MKKLLLVLIAILSLTVWCGCNGGKDRQQVPQSPQPVSDGSSGESEDELLELPACSPGLDLDRDGIPWFVDVAEEVGIAGMPAARLAFGDIDGDLFADFIMHKGGDWARDNSWVYMNRPAPGGKGGRVFIDTTEASNFTVNRDPEIEGRYSNMVAFADIDNDGDLDVFSGSYQFDDPSMDNGDRNELLLNDGKGRFTLALDSGLNTEDRQATQACAFLDYDLDGLVDLFIANQYEKYGYLDKCGQDRLYRNLGGAVFEDVTEAAGLLTPGWVGERDSSKPSCSAATVDYNNDGYPDILVGVYGRQWNYLWENQGDGTFIDAGDLTHLDGDEMEDDWYEDPFRSNGNTFGTEVGDFDNDGDFDVFTIETTHQWAGPGADRSELLVNTGARGGYVFDRVRDRGIYRYHGYGSNWNEGDHYAAWIDFDNDGLLDFFLSPACYPYQFGLLFKQNPDHTFTDVSEHSGLDVQDMGAVVLADYDKDGDVDILVATVKWGSWTPYDQDDLHIFENRVGQNNNWLKVVLEGKGEGGANRAAVGSRVVVQAGDLAQTREVFGGRGHFGGQSELIQTFGLGRWCDYCKVSVTWANQDHTVQTFNKVLPNRTVRIVEGMDRVTYLD